MPNSILHTENLTKNYGSSQAISNVNFFLEKGEVHAIIGANGAGKSTFVKALFGEVVPTSGKIFIKDKQKKISSPGKAMQNGIAMVSQDFGLVNTMTIAENLAINNADGRKKIIYNSHNVRETANQLLSSLSLNFNIDEYVGNLSVSEKQLIAIAKALTITSDILIFDEPTSVLGSNSFRIIKDLIKRLQGSGKSIIYITHKIEEVFDLADSVSVFKDGIIKLTTKISHTSKNELLLFFNIPAQGIKEVEKDNTVKPPLLVVSELSTRNVNKTSFSVDKGEIVGITCDNNTYAVELAKAIYGLVPKLSGTIKIKNIEIKNKPYENVRHNAGFIPEDRRLEGMFNNLTVHDNIALLQLKQNSTKGFLNIGSLKTNSIEKIKNLGIKCKSIFQPVSELSGGNQQKVLFARWMSYDFDLLILIEPTAGIDLSGKSEIYSLMLELKKKGKSFIVVSTDADEIEILCDRIISLDAFSNAVTSN